MLICNIFYIPLNLPAKPQIKKLRKKKNVPGARIKQLQGASVMVPNESTFQRSGL